MTSPLISYEEFEKLRTGPNPPMLFECTWISTARKSGYQGMKDGPDQAQLEQQAFEEGHIPGSGQMDVQRDLSAPHSDTVKFNFTRETDSASLAKRLGALGIPNTLANIVLYARPTPGPGSLKDNTPSGLFGATRSWWTLGTWGFQNVRVLDGGYENWKAMGGKPETGKANMKAVNFDSSSLVDKGYMKATADEVLSATKGNGVQLMDTLPGWPNTAKTYGRDPARQGHIPTANNANARELLLLDNHGKLKDLATIKAYFEKEGTDLNKPLIAY